MMPTSHELSSEGEVFWREFKVLLEWAAGFELVFLFTDNAIVSQRLRQRINAMYGNNPTPLHYFEPATANGLIADCLAFLQALSGKADEAKSGGESQPSPIWLELNQYGDDWCSEQTNLLQRINERRDGLRSRNPQPLIMVLSTSFADRVYRLAPDLWSVRTFSRVLDHTFLAAVKAIAGSGSFIDAAGAPDAPDGRVERSERSKVQSGKADDISRHSAIVEWQRLLAKGAAGLDVFDAGYHAYRVAFDGGYYSQARQIALPLLAMARQFKPLSQSDPECLRILYLALHCQGWSNEVDGKPTAAEADYAEALQLARQLQTLLPGNLEVLRNISVTLERLGNIYQQSGKPGEALDLFSQSLTLHRQRQQLLADPPELLRDIAMALNRLGETYRQQGEPTEALALFSESLALFRQLQQLLGDQPEVLRDISLALARMGNIEQQLGNFNRAQALCCDALALACQLRQLLGGQPQVLMDICRSQLKLGEIHQLQQQPNQAAQYYHEGLTILQQLQKRQPNAACIEPWRQWVGKQMKVLAG